MTRPAMVLATEAMLVGVGDLIRCQVQLLFDGWHKWRNREPSEEGDEEGQPCEVEGSHVGSLEAEQLDLDGSVILHRVGGDSELASFGDASVLDECFVRRDRVEVIVRFLGSSDECHSRVYFVLEDEVVVGVRVSMEK